MNFKESVKGKNASENKNNCSVFFLFCFKLNLYKQFSSESTLEVCPPDWDIKEFLSNNAIAFDLIYFKTLIKKLIFSFFNLLLPNLTKKNRVSQIELLA